MPDQPELRIHRGKYVAVLYSEDGKRYRRSLGTADEAEAKRRLAHLTLTNSVLDRTTQKTVEDIYQRYLTAKKAEGKNTTRLECSWQELSKTFGHLYPQYVTPELVSSYKKSRKISRGTLHLELGFLRTILRWGYKRQLLKDPVFVELPSKPPPKTHYITKEQFKTLIKVTDKPHLVLFMVLAVTTGARSNAILDLTWDRVDLERRIINLRNPELFETNKGRADVPINDSALRYLLEAKKGARTQYVIEYAGNRVKHVRSAMADFSRRLPFRISAHMFRHSAAVWMAEGGTPMAEISQYLGHSNTQITERIYARFSPGYLRKAASHLEI